MKEISFNADDFDGPWPFTVQEITIFCVPGYKKELYFRANGKTYALNSTAVGKVIAGNNTVTKLTYQEVWNEGFMKFGILNKFIEAGLGLCT